MKKLLIPLFLFFTTTANSSNTAVELEYMLLVKETWLVRQAAINDGYASLFFNDAVGSAYFKGKADTYRELLSIIEH